MKHNSKKKSNRYEYEDEDDYPDHTSHKKESSRRRPVRNWTKAWVEHQTDYDDYDEFFGK